MTRSHGPSRRLGAATAGVWLFATAPAIADSVDYTAQSTGWTQVAAPNTSAQVQPQGNVVILSTSAAAPTTDQGPRVMPGGPPLCVSLGSQALWAKAVASQALVKTTTVANCSGGAGGSGTAGSTGVDASASPPSIPAVGSAFGAGGPYAGYVLVRTLPAAGGRIAVDVENTSGGQVVLLRDDGSAASGAAPVNASLVPLAGGAAAGAQGGSWTSATFKGRLQIYAPSASAFVSVFVD